MYSKFAVLKGKLSLHLVYTKNHFLYLLTFYSSKTNVCEVKATILISSMLVQCNLILKLNKKDAAHLQTNDNFNISRKKSNLLKSENEDSGKK